MKTSMQMARHVDRIDRLGSPVVAKLRSLLRTTPDARGECDRCHCEAPDLWIVEELGEYVYCRHCIERMCK